MSLKDIVVEIVVYCQTKKPLVQESGIKVNPKDMLVEPSDLASPNMSTERRSWRT